MAAPRVINEISHDTRATLMHWHARPGFKELVRNVSGEITSVIIWTDSGKTQKIRESILTRVAGVLTTVVKNQYDMYGTLVETFTQTLSRNLQQELASVALAATVNAVGIGGSPLNPAGINWTGPWSSLTSYNVMDAVEFEGSSYIATAPSLNSQPAATGTTTPNAGWNLVAKKGDTYEPPPPAFDATLSGGGVVECGQTIVSPAFTASYNRTPTSASIQDNQGNAALNVIGTPTAFVYAHTYQKLVAEQSVVLTLTAADATGPDTSQASYIWRQRAYWGTGVTGLRDSASIRALANNTLATGRARAFSVDAGSGALHIYYAFRAAYGPATFFVGGFEGGFNGPFTVSVTNQYGVTEDYYVYESAQPGLGATTVTVT